MVSLCLTLNYTGHQGISGILSGIIRTQNGKTSTTTRSQHNFKRDCLVKITLSTFLLKLKSVQCTLVGSTHCVIAGSNKAVKIKLNTYLHSSSVCVCDMCISMPYAEHTANGNAIYLTYTIACTHIAQIVVKRLAKFKVRNASTRTRCRECCRERYRTQTHTYEQMDGSYVVRTQLNVCVCVCSDC